MAKKMNVKKEIVSIKERNARVEMDKAWETSKTRKVAIAVLTYFVVVLFFFAAGLPSPFVNALVPSAAFVLSTLSLPYFKEVWQKRIYKK
ncbi:MAG: hypothetical protein AABW59_01200 [archaeon]